jgi:hypothetical protein
VASNASNAATFSLAPEPSGRNSAGFILATSVAVHPGKLAGVGHLILYEESPL